MLAEVEPQASALSIAGGLVSLPVLIAINALFVAAQFALVALRRTRVEEMQREKTAGADAVAAAMDDLDRCVAATQLGTVLIGLLLGWIGEPAVAALLQPLFDAIFETLHIGTFRTLTAIFTFTIITFLSVVFGELIPKTIGLRNSEWTALLIARPLLFFTWLSRPLIRVMDGTGEWILRRIGYRAGSEEEDVYSVGELTSLIEDAAEAGVLPANHAKFIGNMLRFTGRTVAEIVVPLEKVGMIQFGTEPEMILQQIAKGTYTRMPVFHHSREHIVGVANTKQLHRHFTLTGQVALEEMMYPANYVLVTDPLPDAMRAMRQAHFPLAIVRDAQEKVLGIITLENGIEQILGQMTDEHDSPVPKVTPRMIQAFVQSLPKRKAAATRLMSKMK